MITLETLKQEIYKEFECDINLSKSEELTQSWYNYKSILCTPATSPNSWVAKANAEWNRDKKTIILILQAGIKTSKAFSTYVHKIAEIRDIETQTKLFSKVKIIKPYVVIIYKAKIPAVKSHLVVFND